MTNQTTDPLAAAIAAAITGQCDMATETTVVDPVQHVADVAAAAARGVLPAPVDRAATLHEAAEAAGQMGGRSGTDDHGDYDAGWNDACAAIEAELRRMADETAATETCPTPETHNWGCGCPSDEHPVALGTLPAWLHQRFDPRGPDWEQLGEDDRSYWEHQARAVRRAVARGGFKQPAAGARQDGVQAAPPSA